MRPPAPTLETLTSEERLQYYRLLSFVSSADSRGVDDLIGSIEASRIPVVLNASGSGQSETLLHHALRSRRSEEKESALKIIKTLIAAGANPNLLGKSPHIAFPETPLHLAAIIGDVAAVEEMLKAKTVDVNTLDCNGYSALSFATQTGNVKVLRILLEAGAKISIPDNKQGCTSLHIAASECHVEVLEELLERSNKAREFLLKSTELKKVIGEIGDAQQKSDGATEALKSNKARALTSEMKALSQKTGEFKKEFCVDVKNDAGKTALEVAQDVFNLITSGTIMKPAQTIERISEIRRMLKAAAEVTKPEPHSAAAGASTQVPIGVAAAREPIMAAASPFAAAKTPTNTGAAEVKRVTGKEGEKTEDAELKARTAEAELREMLSKEENAAIAKRMAKAEAKKAKKAKAKEAKAKEAEAEEAEAEAKMVAKLEKTEASVTAEAAAAADEKQITPDAAAYYPQSEEMTKRVETPPEAASQETLYQSREEATGELLKTLTLYCQDGEVSQSAKLMVLIDSGGADIDARNESGETPLNTLAKSKRKSMIKVLIDRGADIAKAHEIGDKMPEMLPIHYAALAGDKDLVEIYIEKGIDCNLATKNGKTALFIAIEYLLEKSKQEKDGLEKAGAESPFIDGNENHLETIKFLIEKSARVNAQTKEEREIIEKLKDLAGKGLEPFKKILDDLSDAFKKEQAEKIKNLLGIQPKAAASQKATPPQTELQTAAYGESVVQEAGSNNDKVIGAEKDHEVDKRTPIQRAIIDGNTSQLKRLLAAGDVDVNALDKDGISLLSYAAYHGKKEICETLLEEGANINLPDKTGITPLMHAAASKQKEVLQFLLEKGAKFLLSSNDNDSAAEEQAMRRQLAENQAQVALLILLTKGARFSMPTEKYEEFLEKEINKQEDSLRTELLNELKKIYTDGEIPSVVGAAFNGDYFALTEMIREGSAAIIETELSPLIAASTVGHLKACEALLETGVDIDSQDGSGYTALMRAAKAKRSDVCQLLLSRGADSLLGDEEGNNALKIASSVPDSSEHELREHLERQITLSTGRVEHYSKKLIAQKASSATVAASPGASPATGGSTTTGLNITKVALKALGGGKGPS